MKYALLIVCLLCCVSTAQQPPKTVTKMVVQLQSTDVPPDSFGAKPKTMLRAGTKYCRIEELPDPDNGIQGLIVINEPDVWMVNLSTRTAKHMVDPGPTFNCRMPIFANRVPDLPEDEGKQIGGLEFGFEMEFFKTAKSTSTQGSSRSPAMSR